MAFDTEYQDIRINIGSTFSLSLALTDDDGEEVDLTGYIARMHIRSTLDAGSTIHELTTENDGITLGGEEGTIDLYIAPADTAGFSATYTAVYDLEIEESGGDVWRIMEGRAEIIGEVTREA